MSITLDLNNKVLSFPSNLFTGENWPSGKLSTNEKNSYWNTNTRYTIPNILSSIQNNDEKTSDINIRYISLKGTQPNYFIKNKLIDMSKNFYETSTKSYMNILVFEGNNTFAIFIYYKNTFQHPVLKIIGTADTLIDTFMSVNVSNKNYIDAITMENNIVYYQSIKSPDKPGDNNNDKKDCPKCPDCPACNSCCPSSPGCPAHLCRECTDTKPYIYGLIVCTIIIVIMLSYYLYSILNNNKNKNIMEFKKLA